MTAFLWFILGAVPVVALVLAFAPFFFDKKRRGVGEYDPKTGIGRGAPGFQTSVKRVAVPAALAARIRAGEQVSPEEIEAAQREAAEAAAKGATIGTSSSLPSASGSGAVERTRYNEVVNEWLPENLQGAAGARKGKKKAGKR
ncbi:unnamed protein product [Tilletia controversa]|uniref:Uncharacterized protein n=2 Tax=Tilletia TaxID=13289 RepID=A0A8X7MU81_9BASI|nr:hypothetical protein CF336_g6661 [Tilletia laevis]KAE8200357.1 hypothetical protein CF328_g2986 [Tilletia controversa]KAE8253213.1 hypothetical protein A4X03_0g5959 [Tilletia caries]KAE8192254.1 hypothetical protein CF335_g5880 [Tilletia laevis]KAE8247989.1 hypothetical protein A4X06_0g4039 [Tilletia controversa]